MKVWRGINSGRRDGRIPAASGPLSDHELSSRAVPPRTLAEGWTRRVCSGPSPLPESKPVAASRVRTWTRPLVACTAEFSKTVRPRGRGCRRLSATGSVALGGKGQTRASAHVTRKPLEAPAPQPEEPTAVERAPRPAGRMRPSLGLGAARRQPLDAAAWAEQARAPRSARVPEGARREQRPGRWTVAVVGREGVLLDRRRAARARTCSRSKRSSAAAAGLGAVEARGQRARQRALRVPRRERGVERPSSSSS